MGGKGEERAREEIRERERDVLEEREGGRERGEREERERGLCTCVIWKVLAPRELSFPGCHVLGGGGARRGFRARTERTFGGFGR